MQLYRMTSRRLPATSPRANSLYGPLIRVHSGLRFVAGRAVGLAEADHFAVEISQNCPIITSSPENAGIA
jgi:hypothetical protein